MNILIAGASGYAVGGLGWQYMSGEKNGFAPGVFNVGMGALAIFTYGFAVGYGFTPSPMTAGISGLSPVAVYIAFSTIMGNRTHF